jgi:hypothetical protein
LTINHSSSILEIWMRSGRWPPSERWPRSRA